MLCSSECMCHVCGRGRDFCMCVHRVLCDQVCGVWHVYVCDVCDVCVVCVCGGAVYVCGMGV